MPRIADPVPAAELTRVPQRTDPDPGYLLIRCIFAASAALRDVVKVVYEEKYDMRWAQKIRAGVDLWLNTPLRPQEASGTRGTSGLAGQDSPPSKEAEFRARNIL